MKLYFQVKTLCLSSNQDLILYEGDSNFERATSKNTPILRACWRVNKHSDPIFLFHFHNVHIIRPVGRGGAMGAPAPPRRLLRSTFFVKKINSKKK